MSFIQVKKTSERICENLHIIANEPSLAFYRIAEHVRKVSGPGAISVLACQCVNVVQLVTMNIMFQALPPTVESRAEVKRLNQQLTGAFYDAEYGLE